MAAFALMSGAAALFFNACDKDTNCYVQVRVVDLVQNDTFPVNNAWVKIDSDSSMVKAEGYTNQLGLFETMFSAPAIFNVAVKLTVADSTYPATNYDVYRKGNNTVRLKEGDTVLTIVILEKDTLRLPRQRQ